MPRFVFKLEAVLRQRKQIEEQRQRELALAREQARLVEEELRSLDQSLKSTLEDLRKNRLVGTLDLHFLAAHRRYTVSMQRKGQGLVQKLAAMQPVIEAKRQALAEAAKRRKAIEKLKERRRELWLADLTRRENAELDEISNQLFFTERESVA